jgi:hypothetical protein
MEPVKVDKDSSIRLAALVPGAYYEAEIVSSDEIKLRRVAAPQGQESKSREEVIRTIEQSPLRFTRSWEDLKRETRE